ncbi:hypothetical protein ACI8AF_23450 [Blastococcus sp. SYSU D00669]
MAGARVRYELRIETVVSPAALATFRVPVQPTAVPRRTVFRLRVPADRDLSEVVDRLTARDVELLEIRRCDEASPPRRPRDEPPEPEATTGRVVPLHRADHARRTMPGRRPPQHSADHHTGTGPFEEES